jgi:hypothetical protein
MERRRDSVWWTVDGRIVGRCAGCQRVVPAVGLAVGDDHMTRSGDWILGTWQCAACKPRRFGRVRGGPEAGGWRVADWGTGGRGLAPMTALGRGGDGPKHRVTHRARKPKPMTPLGGGQ